MNIKSISDHERGKLVRYEEELTRHFSGFLDLLTDNRGLINRKLRQIIFDRFVKLWIVDKYQTLAVVSKFLNDTQFLDYNSDEEDRVDAVMKLLDALSFQIQAVQGKGSPPHHSILRQTVKEKYLYKA